MNVIWRKDQRETYALILNFVPQTFFFHYIKKGLCSKFAFAPATYLLLSHQKKNKRQKKRTIDDVILLILSEVM